LGAHLLALADTIDKALNPRGAAPANPLAALVRVMGAQAADPWDPMALTADCWPAALAPWPARPVP
ncbi:hypothetical protein WDZ92_41250, partial [Nostoc sp. NIES-2111]